VLAFQRVLGYFPYFVIGVTMKADGHSKLLLQFVSKRRSKVWAVVMMGVHILSMAYASLDRMCLESVMFSSNIHQSTCMRGAFPNPSLVVSYLKVIIFINIVVSSDELRISYTSCVCCDGP
jgi:hypothetical protein